jgi:hypothetical protein
LLTDIDMSRRFEREIPRDDAEIEGNTAMNRRSCSIEVSRSTVRGTAPTLRRRVALLATCAAALFLVGGAPDALAQTTSKTKTVDKDFTASPSSPCTGEVVDVEGTHILQMKIQQTGGNTRYTSKDEQHGKGVGEVSMALYRFEAMSQDTTVVSSSPSCAFYIRKTSTERLIRQGDRPQIADDFFAKFQFLMTMTKDCQTVLTVERFDAAECR